MDHKRYDDFRQEVADTGLSTQAGQFDEKPRFYLDLNQGGICVQADAASLLTIVQLARKHGMCEEVGEHVAILNLVAERSRMDEKHVMWHRPYHVEASRGDLKWVCVRDWLAEQGHPYTSTAEAA